MAQPLLCGDGGGCGRRQVAGCPHPSTERSLAMWILEFALTSLWMLGVAFGLTMGGWIHVVALAVLALVFIENTSVEQKLRSLFAR
jgi:hypothetical protein